MTDFLRKLLGVVIIVLSLSPLSTYSPVLAQTAVDGSGCWPSGSLSITGAQMSWPSAPATIIDPALTYQAKLQTTAGEILIQLDPVNAPIATNNFVCLALAGYYSGTDFHRIIANTFIQGGDPTATGLGNPGYTIPSDPTVGSYPVGSVAMANSGPNRNGSQFFIAAADLSTSIPADYPVFGQVIGGMDVVTAISNGAVTPNSSGEQSKPVDPSILLSVSITAAQSGATTGGTTGGTTEGPVIAAPTATTIAVATAVPTVASAGGAQSRPGGSTAATNPTPVTGVTGSASCEGFEEYTTAFDDAYMNTALANGDALAFLMSLQNSTSSDSMFEQMTSEQAAAMSEFYAALADAIALITPPPFAAQWHNVQIEIFRALGVFTGNISSQGLTIASMQASPIVGDLIDRSDAALAAAVASCPDFQAWASGEA